MRRSVHGISLVVILGTAVAVGCGGGSEEQAAPPESAAATTSTAPLSVSITMPAEGDTVRGNAVHVMLSASGIVLAPAAEQRPGTAHHHLYLDTDLGVTDAPIPAGQANIVHLGNAETEYHWANVSPGTHRIIAVLADPAHVPLNPLVADTVSFVVVP
jgi:hypothetical protein